MGGHVKICVDELVLRKFSSQGICAFNLLLNNLSGGLFLNFEKIFFGYFSSWKN